MKVQFGACLLDTSARLLTRDGEGVHLSPKAFDLLRILIEQRPAVVDKAALREQLWPGVHVVDASLSNLVTEIRSALGPSPIIRTVHGVGYAFPGAGVELPDGAGHGAAAVPGACWVVWNGRPLPLAPGENVVGRDPGCRVWTDSSGVSRRHACIRVVEGPRADATIEDLGSTNGTYVDGRLVTGPVPLTDGDRVGIGSETLVFRARSGAEAPTKRVRLRKGRA